MDFLPILTLIAIMVVGIGLPFAAFRHDRFGSLLIAATVILGAVVTFDVIALSTGFLDADGFTDCWPGCSGWQQLATFTFWLGSLLWFVLVVVAIGSLTTGHRR